ncbi:hypothetical protein DFH09DRAFT_928332 [Mycena vulgaris]|nr:hypothetical protein DFH09DRAFT_928332 [Mycena vulgaris]
MLSKFVDVEYSSKICKQAYPPGEFFPVPLMLNIEDVNKLGGPTEFRKDTPLRPFKLIPNAVHHYDENGLADHSQEPPEIQAIHQQEVEIAKGWVVDFKKEH